MILKSSKKVHFFNFVLTSAKKSKYVKASYIYAPENSHYALSENVVYYAMTSCFEDISVCKTVMKTLRSIYLNCFNRLRLLPEVSTKLQKMHFLDNLKTTTQKGSMETRQMTPFFHLLFLLYYFKVNPVFSAVLFSENYLNPQGRINKIVNTLLITTLVLHN